MTKAWIPNRFRGGDIVDGERINENLRALERDCRRVNDLAYNYCTTVVPLTGMTQADTQAMRSVVFRSPAGTTVDVVGIELSIYATTGVTWTLTATDASGRVETMTLATVSATEEAVAASSRSLRAPVTFVLTGSAANTITRGSIVLTLRAARHVQGGASRVDYVPKFVDATTSSSGSVLDTELTAAEAAVTANGLHATDLRCECVLTRASAGGESWALPSGAGRTGQRAMLQVVATAAVTMTFFDGTNTLAVAGTGTSNTVLADMALASKSDDPTNTSADLIYTLTPSAAVALAYSFLWWS